MGTLPKQWPDHYHEWPANNSNAAKDRDEAALCAAEIRRLARLGLKEIATGKLSTSDLLFLLARVDGRSSDILRLLERNGAPTTTTR
jgi:hypothetical protein